MTEGARRIVRERDRQLAEEGWTAEHDAHWEHGEIARAAACYAWPIPATLKRWPWDWKWWKPSPHDRIRELEKAGALIAAEIDRLLAE